MVGILGGLYIVLDMLFHLIAPRFSQSFFFSDVASRLFMMRKNDDDGTLCAPDQGNSLKNQFKEVDIGWLPSLLAAFTCCKMCRPAGMECCKLVKVQRSS